MVYEHGAHLTSWTPIDQAPVLWLSSRARFEPAVAIRGGVPIIFPWFGAGRSGDLAPAHGFARTQQWKLLEWSRHDDSTVATLVLEGSREDDPSFPFAFAARYQIRLGRSLHLSLTVENTDEQPFVFEEALHAYFAIGDVRQVVVTGLDGCSYLDQADANGLTTKVQQGDVTFTGETDRIYSASGQIRVVDEVLKRVIIIEKEHSASTVVWNPWIDKAKRMSDFGDHEWSSMLCVEGGNLRHAAIGLQPGQSHTMHYSVRIDALA